MHFPINFLNKDILLDISFTVFKIDILILDTVMEGTMSHVSAQIPLKTLFALAIKRK